MLWINISLFFGAADTAILIFIYSTRLGGTTERYAKPDTEKRNYYTLNINLDEAIKFQQRKDKEIIRKKRFRWDERTVHISTGAWANLDVLRLMFCLFRMHCNIHHRKLH